jgi:hypothetical protein
MEELNEELSALSNIFTPNEFEVVKDRDSLAVTFPLPFRIGLHFDIRIVGSDMYDITVAIIDRKVSPLELVLKAANAARVAAEKFLAGRERGEHKHLYSAHQRAIDAFDECISIDRGPAPKRLEQVDSKIDISYTKAEDTQITDDTSDVPDALPETTVVMIDHINDTKRYYKMLTKWSQQLNMACIILAKTPSNAKGDRTKHIVMILQSPDCNAEFMQRLKTEKVDLNMAGKPCKERCAAAVLTSRQYNYFEMNDTFQIFDCSTAATVRMLSETYKVPEISNLVSNFCWGKL